MKIIDDYVQRRVDGVLEELQKEFQDKNEKLRARDVALASVDEKLRAKDLELLKFKIETTINMYDEGCSIEEIVKAFDAVFGHSN